MMKRELKICLPVYKIVYSLCYVVILSVIQGVAYVDEIGGAFGLILGMTGSCALILLFSIVSAVSAVASP